jgi:putative intracellular protease/amidase
MLPYLESAVCHRIVAAFDAKPARNAIAAVCHGVVLAGRAGILKGRRVTALEWWQESLAHNLTRLWKGNYYKTYPDRSVESEVTAACGEFVHGPKGFGRDTPDAPGFCVVDRNLVTFRWPGDCYSGAAKFAGMIAAARATPLRVPSPSAAPAATAATPPSS